MAKGVLGLGGWLLPRGESAEAALDSYAGAWKSTYDDGQMTRKHVLREALDPDVTLRAKRRVYDARIANGETWDATPMERLAARAKASSLPSYAVSRYRHADGNSLADYVLPPAD